MEAKGRFKPGNVIEWLDKYTIPVETKHLEETGAAELLDTIGKKK